MPPLAHFYHVFAAGNWAQPVTEHCDALVRFGLYDELDTLMVGFVGSPEQIAAVRCTLDVLVPRYEVCAESPEGWEQVTLDPLYRFVQDHNGLVSYAHTKGASRNDPIDLPWRRAMEYYNFVDWKRPVDALAASTCSNCQGEGMVDIQYDDGDWDEAARCETCDGAGRVNGKSIAGCHWHRGGPSSVPGYGTGGMFGGNYFWTHAELLRQNVPPGRESRFAAEHWLGQLSEVMPITAETIEDLHPGMIHDLASVPAW